MATTGSYFYIEPENITLKMEYSGTTPVSSGWIYLDASIFPDYYTSDNFELIADNYSSGDGIITVTTTAGGVDISTTLGEEGYLSISRDSIITRFKVDVVGRNNQSSGYVHLRYLSEQIYITYDSSKKPVMNITSISNDKISAIEGHDECIVKFYSDLTLTKAEVRATLSGATTGHGVGTLVEEIGRMYAGVIYSALIENGELTNGDQEYTISIFGYSTEGRWSDG